MLPGESHSMLLYEDGSVWGCGLNSDHQLGIDSSMHQSEKFVQVIPSGVKSVAAGFSHSIVLKRDETVWATGQNSYGQLGDGTTTDKDAFTFVQLFRGAKVVAAGGWHSMILTETGVVWTAGWNKFGQLGVDDSDYGSIFSPEWRQTIADAKAIAAGHHHSIVLQNDGSVWAAGRNAYGQLGDGSRIDKSNFVQAQDSDGAFMTAIAIAAGGYHSLALTEDSRVFATGWNIYGQLGDGSLGTDGSATFEPIVHGVKAIAAGTRHSMILTDDGSVWTTGYNEHGELGDGSTITRSNFRRVITSGAKAIAAGGYHSMAVKLDGSIWATGSNEFGQIGDGSTTARDIFARVSQISDGALNQSMFTNLYLLRI